MSIIEEEGTRIVGISDGPKMPIEEYRRLEKQRYWMGEMPDKIWDGEEPISDSWYKDKHGRKEWENAKASQNAKIRENQRKAKTGKAGVKKSEKMEMAQHLPLFFDVLDNPVFRNGLMKKDRWRTYLWLARHIIRQKMNRDALRIYETYYKKGKLASCIPTRALAKALGIARQTANDHINALETDGLIIKDTIEGKKSWDGQRYTICVFGTHKDGKQHWFIQDAFGVSGK